YIGITGLWLTPNIELYDILICIDLIKYLHTAENRLALVKKIQELHLNDKVKHAVTDNEANVIKAIREWDGIDRITCTSHTLQQTLTSSDRELQDSNEPINIPGGSLQILCTIADCKIRWGSTLASWKKLLELKEVIKRTLKNCANYFNQLSVQPHFWVVKNIALYSTLESIGFYYIPLIEDDDENEEDDDNELEDDDEESDDEDEGESESDEEKEDEQHIRPNVTTRQQSQHQQLQQQSKQQ
ncbi:hypothetical protein RclHR1_13910001, partial [Rhizophagus clarus]